MTKPSLRDAKMAIVPDYVYEDEHGDDEYEDEVYKTFADGAKFEEVDNTSSRSGDQSYENYIIKNKETNEYWLVSFYYSSWDGVDWDDFTHTPYQVEKKQVTKEEWVKV